MDRNLALEFVRVTEVAAIAAARWAGKGDKIKADQAAVDEMRSRFNAVEFDGIVVIGEGEKDNAPYLYTGEKIGNKQGPKMDIAVDPLECTENTAKGKSNAMSVLAAGPRGSMLKVPGTYMNHICVGPDAVNAIDINKPIDYNIKSVAEALGKPVGDLMVCLLERDRHKELLSQIRATGCRVKLIEHGTVSAGISTCMPYADIDMLVGTGGAPEAIIIASALKCLGGNIQAMMAPHNEKTLKECKEFGLSLDKVYRMNDLAKGDNFLFAATGVSDGSLLNGVRFHKDKIITHSLVLRSKTKTKRFITTEHYCDPCTALPEK